MEEVEKWAEYIQYEYRQEQREGKRGQGTMARTGEMEEEGGEGEEREEEQKFENMIRAGPQWTWIRGAKEVDWRRLEEEGRQEMAREWDALNPVQDKHIVRQKEEYWWIRGQEWVRIREHKEGNFVSEQGESGLIEELRAYGSSIEEGRRIIFVKIAFW